VTLGLYIIVDCLFGTFYPTGSVTHPIYYPPRDYSPGIYALVPVGTTLPVPRFTIVHPCHLYHIAFLYPFDLGITPRAYVLPCPFPTRTLTLPARFVARHPPHPISGWVWFCWTHLLVPPSVPAHFTFAFTLFHYLWFIVGSWYADAGTIYHISVTTGSSPLPPGEQTACNLVTSVPFCSILAAAFAISPTLRLVTQRSAVPSDMP